MKKEENSCHLCGYYINYRFSGGLRLCAQCCANSIERLLKRKHISEKLLRQIWRKELMLICLLLNLTIHAGTVKLVWTNPNSAAYSTNGVNIYATTNVALPVSQWPLLAYITNSPPGTNSFITNLPPANYFFVAEFTNTFWNFALPFSDPAAYTPPLPTNLLTGLSITNR